MLRKSLALGAILLLLGGLWVAPSFAGQPRIIIAEEFGATW